MAGTSFGELLALHRDRMALTQEELAERAGMSVRGIRDLERGRAKPRRSSVGLLVEALGLAPEAAADMAVAASAPAQTSVALQMPPAPTCLVGRDEVIQRLTNLVRKRARSDVPPIVLAGPGGVGKTATLIQLAHEVADLYPDRQLYLDLRGMEEPLPGVTVLRQLLNACGVKHGLPDDVEELAARLASVTAQMRMLVVLDNADRQEQLLRLMLPLRPGCLALVAARRPLVGSIDRHLELLDRLDVGAASMMLAQLAGEDRVAADRQACEDVIEACDRLPLALRIAAGKLSMRPHWTVRDLAVRLSEQHRRLDRLRLGDLGVRANISLSDSALSGAARRMLRLTSLLDVAELPSWLVEAFSGLDAKATEAACDELVEAQLLDSLGHRLDGCERFRLHDLVRLFALEGLRADIEDGEVGEAVGRGADALVGRVSQADEQLSRMNVQPYGPLWTRMRRPSQGLVWLPEDYPIAMALLRAAAGRGLTDAVWRLGAAIGSYQENSGLVADWLAAAELASTAAQDNIQAAATAGPGLASAYLAAGKYAEARHTFEATGRLAVQLGDRDLACHAQAGVATATGYLGDWGRAYAAAAEAIDLIGGVGDPGVEASVWRVMGLAARRSGRTEEALACYEKSLGHFEGTWRTLVAHEIARCKIDLGDAAAARDQLTVLTEQAVDEHYSLPWHAAVLASLGRAHRDCGDFDAAVSCFLECGRIFHELGDIRWYGHTFVYLAAVEQARGDLAAAEPYLDRAEELFKQVNDVAGLAAVNARRGEQ